MNEGHSAFLALERIRLLMEEERLSFSEAREAATSGHVFTTHTPVAAGIDWFHPDLVDRYFHTYYTRLGLSRDEFLGLGRMNAYGSQRLLLHGDPGHAPGMQNKRRKPATCPSVAPDVARVWPQVPIEE
jgi:glucan phosphorylase